MQYSSSRHLLLVVFFLTLFPGLSAVTNLTAQDKPDDSSNPTESKPTIDAESAKRLGEDIRYLASDELEGRGPNTKGLELAAQHMEACFRELGLKGIGEDGSYRQPFEIPVDTKLVKEQVKLAFTSGDTKLELEMGKDFQPLAAGASGEVSADVVFVGYGITAPKLKYEEYKGADAKGKVVVVLRREPQQGDEKSVFDGKRTSQYAFIRSKLQAAIQAGAAAIIMVNDPFSTKDKPDALTPPVGFGSNGAKIPFLHLSQKRFNEMLAASPVKAGDETLKTVDEIGAHIDTQLKPLSQPMQWKVELSTKFESVKASVANIVGVLEGEGPLADETIVVGAHYDHLGFGPFGSRRPNERKVHNGADDNATGTAAVMELARRFAKKDKPARRIVFIGFTGEERGVLGSNYYLKNPSFPLEKTVAMINFDMIGMYTKQGLTLGGVPTGRAFSDVVAKAAEGFEINIKQTRSVGGSDHAGFYRQGIPVMFFHTGLTDLYHTPEDDFDTIDVEGATHTTEFAGRVVDQILALDKAPEFVRMAPAGRRRAVVYLGIVPRFDPDTQGIVLDNVAEGSPAAKAGLEKGDVIVELGGAKLARFNQLPQKLRTFKVGDKVDVVVRRGDDTKKFTITLAAPPK